MSNLVSPMVTASAGEILPSFSSEAVKISGAGLELSASSPRYTSVNEIGDLQEVDVIFGVRLFPGTGEHDAFFVLVKTLKKFTHSREWSDLWKIFFSEQLRPVVIQFFAETFDLLRRKKFG